ncbi:AraC family transcriptional regulator [Zymobacter sp. IVIA_12111.31 C1]|uniref:AraC family transcriptional regulator n=1 Tax=Zymobacter sp. IVIA_12111.31 C1 TaxID=3394854 RepID=UPI0039C03657
MTDRFEALLEHFSLKARTFHSGPICGVQEAEIGKGVGLIHLVYEGEVSVHHNMKEQVYIDQPSLLVYPRALPHTFVIPPQKSALLVCARLAFGGGEANLLASSLPDWFCVPLTELGGAEGVLSLLHEEAFKDNCGRQAVLDRLFEVVLIYVLRLMVQQRELQPGLLAGMAHPRLRSVLIALHGDSAREWTLESMAALAGMSRSVFANEFREVMGCTPAAYLQRWRIGLTQQALLKGQSLKLITHEVGYSSEAALSRAFKAQLGLTPRQWLHEQEALPS